MSYIGNPIVSTDFPVDYASGNGSTTAFTLSIAPASVNAIAVSISGVKQSPKTYSVSGTTLTFSAAPPVGTDNIVIEHKGIAGIPNTPSAGSVVTASIANNAVTPAKMANGGAELGYRNRIINGAMVIAQRGTGTTTTAFVNQVDQFQVATNAGTFTFGQSTNAPANFSNSAVVTNTASLTPSGTNYYSIRNVIEGLNVTDLAWGTANAKTVTLSFWVRSSVTGTFGGSVFNGSVNRSYPFTYAISSANTWEQKSITITGDTTGTWATDNTAGIYIEWALGTGSTYQGTAGTWAAARYQGATGQTQWSTTSGATFYITGVQLEVGNNATGFDYRPYGTELALCQRYYQTIGYYLYGAGASGGGNSWVGWQFKVTMRANPTIANPNSSGGALNQAYPDGATWYYGGGYATFGASSTATAEL